LSALDSIGEKIAKVVGGSWKGTPKTAKNILDKKAPAASGRAKQPSTKLWG